MLAHDATSFAHVNGGFEIFSNGKHNKNKNKQKIQCFSSNVYEFNMRITDGHSASFHIESLVNKKRCNCIDGKSLSIPFKIKLPTEKKTGA
eukprot:14597847-Ditylum_brightwellii.AAC.1